LKLALLVVLVAAPIGLAQSGGTAKPPQDQRPTFKTQANFVRVDVYPTADGRPVMDLRAADFELLEDGVPQAIDSFEHVNISPAGPQSLRSEPNTIEASRQLAANPRNRVFVLFLDVPHVTVQGAWHAREPLVRLIDRMLGPDDLVGIMTPHMSAADLVLARKTDVVAGGLRDKWPWGERFTLEKSELEWDYERCYPWPETKGVVSEMIHRRRERATLDALNELVHHLGVVRDDRKAILTVSEGWLLFRPNEDLTRPRTLQDGSTEPLPGPDPVGIGPGGKLMLGNPQDLNGNGALKSECDRDRLAFSMMDNWRYFRDIMEDANRWNASFYTVDPRGLPAWDSALGPEKPPSVTVDQRILTSRLESLRTLAENTDGLAVTNSNDLDKGLRRIADDLTSYYLLGYYSTNTEFDGKFRRITVRVKRPGVEVRARRGYRAATADEVTAARAAAGPPVPEPVRTVQAAVATLERLRSVARLRVNATASASTVWVYGEFQSAGTDDPLLKGATADVQVTAGAARASARAVVAPGQRTFLVPVALDAPPSTPIDIRARLSGGGGPALTDSVRVERGVVPAPVLYRRGPSTGNRLQPAAAPQFSRTERVRLEVPIGADVKPGTARILDRAAQPLNVPVTIAERTDATTGQRWMTADLTLAALTMGDYVVELSMTTTVGEQRVVTALRVGR
jgi:VWFA-related protein